MRAPSDDIKVGKQTVSLTIDADLYAQAMRLGIDLPQIVEEALIRQVARRNPELQAEIQQDLAAANAYMAEHGSFAEMVRRHGCGSDGE